MLLFLTQWNLFLLRKADGVVLSLWNTISQTLCCAVSWDLYPQRSAGLQSNPAAGPCFEAFGISVLVCLPQSCEYLAPVGAGKWEMFGIRE